MDCEVTPAASQQDTQLNQDKQPAPARLAGTI